jgi:glucose dehydrogenase
VVSSPAVAGGTVFIGSYDYSVYALNASTGVKIWSYRTGDHVYSSPAVVSGIVFIGSEDGTFYAFGPGGEIPEFPSFLFLPLFMAATLIAVIAQKTKRFSISRQ